MRTLPSDFNGFRLANAKFGFVITLKGLVPTTSACVTSAFDR